MRGFRGLPWLSALLITGNVFLRTVSAVPTDLVARGTFEDLRAQVDDMVNILSEVEGSMIDKAIAAKDLNDELKRTIEEKRKKPFLTSKTLKILFVEFQGSQGDVGKDEAYLKAIQLNAVRRLEWFVNLFTNQHPYELRFVVDCRAKDYLSDETKNNFKRDIAKCGTDQDGFKKNVHDVLSGFKPHVIIRGHAVERLYAEKPKEPEQPPTDPPVDPPQGPPEDTDNPMDLDPNLFPGGQPQDPSDFDPNDDQPPPFVMRAMPRHAVQKRADNDNSDQGDESDRDEEGSEVSDSSSFELNEQADVLPPVHITDFSEAPETADEGTPFMNDFKKPIDERVTDDTLVVIDLKSYYKLPWWIKRPSEYMLTPKRVTLVGQTPDWYEGFSLEDSRQVLIGRAPSPDRKPIPKELDDWINKQKNVMYIGQGGNLRSSEETLEGVTPVIKALTEDVLKDGKYGDWSFIIFHNHPRNKDDTKPVETNDGRAYHIWYPANLPSIFANEKVKITSHHCGKGSFDDSIIGKAAQLCIPQSGFGKDMKYWAEQLVKYKIGAHAPPIGFSDSKLPKAEYKGLQAPYDSDNKVKEAFVDIVTNLETYQKNTEPRKELLEDTTTSAKLLLEVINRLGIGMMKRRTAGTKLPDVEPREIIPEPAGS